MDQQIPKQQAKENIKSDFNYINGMHYRTLSTGDLSLPKYIRFNFFNENGDDDNNINLDNFIEQIKDKTLKLSNGKIIFSHNTFGLLTKLNKPIKKNNSILIKIPFDLLMTEIKIIHLNYFKYETNIPKKPNYNIQLLEEITYVNSDEKKKIIITDYKEHIQTIESQYYNISSKKKYYTFEFYINN